jgi:hypothetical protein
MPSLSLLLWVLVVSPVVLSQPLQPFVAVNEQGFVPHDFQLHHDPMAGVAESDYPPQHSVWSCPERPVNCLSRAAIEQLIDRQKASGVLQPIRIQTGGQPPETAWLSKLAGTGRGTAQYHVPQNSIARQELTARPEFGSVLMAPCNSTAQLVV